METETEGRNKSVDLTFISRGPKIGEDDVDDEDDDVQNDDEDDDGK